ncbi:hypothetical protein ABXJ56_01905 [Microbacterium chocolatum]|uniref:hypothetical protein n=1 Tax=Microbacterium aurantiacum TaxID=162393 RepID=UPI00338D92C2
MDQTIEAIFEIFSWVGIGLGALLLGLALILYLADGTWLPVRAVIDEVEGGRVARWHDDEVGGVNEAILTAEQDAGIGDADMADLFYRRGVRGRVRLTPGSPVVRGVVRLGGGLFALGVVAMIASLILLFARG